MKLRPVHKASHDLRQDLTGFFCKESDSKYFGFLGHTAFVMTSQLCLGAPDYLWPAHRLALLDLRILHRLISLKFTVLPSQVFTDLASSLSSEPEKGQ